MASALALGLASAANANANTPSMTAANAPNMPTRNAVATPTLLALEQTRQRLAQLASALGSLRRELEWNDPVPDWPSLQKSLTLATRQLDTLASTISSPPLSTLLQNAHAYPLPSFPGRAQEAVLGQLLRKKLEPGVEDWIVSANATCTSAFSNARVFGGEGEGGGSGHVDGDGVASETEMAQRKRECVELWEWAAMKAVEIVQDVPWGIDYTMEELAREGGVGGVRTGVRRKLEAGDDEDDDEDEDEDDDESGDEKKGEDEDGKGGAREDKMDVDVDVERKDNDGQASTSASAPATAPRIPMMSLDELCRVASVGFGEKATPGIAIQ